MGNILWTEAETAKARELVEAGADGETFLRELHRTKSAAYARLNSLFRKRVRTREQRKARDGSMPEARSPVRANPDQLADAMARATAPRSITAFVFGDPPPGWSAFDLRDGARP
jgi:hypothetical protein